MIFSKTMTHNSVIRKWLKKFNKQKLTLNKLIKWNTKSLHKNLLLKNVKFQKMIANIFI